MKRFFFTLLASISSLEYYHGVIFRPFSQVLGFYTVFLLLCSGLLTIQYWYSTLPHYQVLVDQSLQELAANYPEDLTFTWTGQELQLSHYPVLVPPPSVAPEWFKQGSEYVITFTDSVPQTNQYATFFITTATDIYPVSQGQIGEAIALQDFLTTEPFEVTKTTLPSFIEKARNVLFSGLTFAGYLMPLAHFMALFVSSLYVLLLDTFIIFLFIKIQRLPISYKQLFQLGVALLVPAQIIALVTRLANLDVPISMLSLSFWILFIVVFFSWQRKISV
ncbi:MAG: hypothetical protein QG639_641 [Patescibacteria group bacterium]|nr:hypothetical protein [Patescibacteria group bacterium]